MKHALFACSGSTTGQVINLDSAVKALQNLGKKK